MGIILHLVVDRGSALTGKRAEDTVWQGSVKHRAMGSDYSGYEVGTWIQRNGGCRIGSSSMCRGMDDFRRSDAQPAIGAGPFAGRLFNALWADKMAGSRLRRRPWMLLGWEPVGGAYGSFFEVHQDLYFIHILQEEHMALSLSFGMPGIFDQVKDEANDRFMIEKRSSL
eukprot:754678-Pelagomonas_calceolata.AAC.2